MSDNKPRVIMQKVKAADIQTERNNRSYLPESMCVLFPAKHMQTPPEPVQQSKKELKK